MGLGDFISDIFGGKNEYEAKQAQLDRNAYEYGGHQGGANEAATGYGNMAGHNQAKQDEYGAQQQALYNRGQVGLDQSNQARESQQAALKMAADRASGNDLISQRIAAQQGTQLGQQQASAAASARGPAAMALAQQNAAANTAMGQSQIAANAGIAGAQERLGYEQALAAQAGGMRGQDLGAAQTAFGAGAQTGQLGLGAGQLGLGYNQLQNNVQQSQLAAQMNREAQNSANQNAAQGINAGVSGQNAGTNNQNSWGLLGAVSGLTGGLASGGGDGGGGGGGGAPGRAAGGPVTPGHPYVVGEQGPELIVPQHEGTVIPAPQTAALRSGDMYASGVDRVLAGTRGGLDYLSASGKQAGERAVARADAEAAAPTSPGAGGLAVANPGAVLRQQDAERLGLLQARERQGLAPSEAEAREQDVLSARQGREAADAKSASKKEAASGAQKPGIGGMLAGAARGAGAMSGMSGGSLYIPQTYSAPAYVSLPGRELGGPITPGAPVLVGEQGPEMVIPTGGSYDKLSPGGGMDVMGSLKSHSNAATQFMHQGSREDGGAVVPGKSVLVGERGPELVVPSPGQRAGDAAADAAYAIPGHVLDALRFVGDAQGTLWNRSLAGQALHTIGDSEPSRPPPPAREPIPPIRPVELAPAATQLAQRPAEPTKKSDNEDQQKQLDDVHALIARLLAKK